MASNFCSLWHLRPDLVPAKKMSRIVDACGHVMLVERATLQIGQAVPAKPHMKRSKRSKLSDLFEDFV